MNRRTIIFFLLLAATSCEYPLTDDEITHVDPPASSHPLQIDLENTQDTLFIFNKQLLKYRLGAYGLKVHEGEMLLDKDRWVLGETGEVEVDPRDYNPGIYKLSLNLFTSTGTGSLADYTGHEYYAGTREWVALIDYRSAESIQMTADTDENGFLRISWQPTLNLNSQHLRFSRNFNSSYTHHRTYSSKLPGQFIDSCYTCGEVNYQLQNHVYTQDANSSTTSLKISNLPPVPVATYSNFDSVTFTWRKTGYPTRYRFIQTDGYPGQVYLENITDTCITVVQPGFDRPGHYTLSPTPFFANKCPSQPHLSSFVTFGIGQKVGRNSNLYAYNQIEKTFYTNNSDDMKAFDIYSLNEKASLRINNISYNAIYSCPPNSTQIGIATRNAIHLFENSTLTNPTVIPYGFNSPGIDYFSLTSANTAAITLNGNFSFLDLETGQTSASLAIEDYPYYSKWACFSAASDGGQCAIVTRNGIWLYNIINNEFETAYRDQRSYKSVLFDNMNPGRLFLTMEEHPFLELRNADNFSLITWMTLPGKCVLRNIDPETGYLLLTDYTRLYIMDLNTLQIIFSLPSTDSKPMLFNSRIFSYSGYVFDLTPYLP
ncbi:MAG: hypothetical protein CVT94_05620 [Bacteroidetes bacterium HGW-Bacteroidetes-11]|jgi:hypothetical protein|nr:MAG: hypothetical protein CVT94_05620 [Bacteroidetes bacterium HGW-Bacteroidetes-11]